VTRELQPCGTRAAYIRHCARRELIDDACQQANRSQQAAWRKRNARKRRLAELRQQLLFRQLLDLVAGACREEGLLP